MKTKRFIKVTAFILIFTVCFFCVQGLLAGDNDTRDYRRITEFFDQRENSLDAVFLGSSATYAFWSPAIGWQENGITVYSLSSGVQEILAARYLIEDGRKTQPDALYIVNLVSVTEYYNHRIHSLLDGYPLSLTKLKMIDYLSDLGDYSFSERMEFYFPIIRFHGRWSDLYAVDFKKKPELYKGSNVYDNFINNTLDVRGGIWDYEGRAPVTETLEQGLSDLMDYCEEEKVKVLFILTPQSVQDEEKRGRQNTLKDMVIERGFDMLDMNEVAEEIGLNQKTDYYDPEHTNLHGSVKVVDYLSEYLIENYGFEDKRGNEDYADWQLAADKYYDQIKDKLTEEDLKYVTIKE